MRATIRAIALTCTAPAAGFLLLLLGKLAFGLQLPKLAAAGVNLGVVGLLALVVFPRLLGIPFGKVTTGVFLQRFGLAVGSRAWRHVLLGLVLGGCTLTGMLAGSWLTGRYQLDGETVNVPHLVFSLNPALFEELFFRGVLMVVLLGLTRSLWKACGWQILLFGVMHAKSFDVVGLVDIVSVMVISVAFLYTAHRTRSLLAGMVFHWVHDAFLLLVQLPGGEYHGWRENALFYTGLWVMVGVACWIAQLASTHLGVREERELYPVPA